MEEVHKRRKGEPTIEKNDSNDKKDSDGGPPVPPPSGQMPSGLPPGNSNLLKSLKKYFKCYFGHGLIVLR